MNVRVDLQYKGTGFSGWQVQPDVETIQGAVETAVERTTGKHITLYGAGRTDAGVHALCQTANFFIEHDLPPEKYKDALNFYLPRDIRILGSWAVADSFNARKSALWREYRYVIGKRVSALYYDYRWEYVFPLNIDRMNEIASFIIGKHDFSAFCVVASQKENNECRVMESEWHESEDEFIYKIRADRFLHTMVRSLIGLMTEAGKDKDYLTLDNFRNIMDSKDHTRIKKVAPPQGLYLVKAGYE